MDQDVGGGVFTIDAQNISIEEDREVEETDPRVSEFNSEGNGGVKTVRMF